MHSRTKLKLNGGDSQGGVNALRLNETLTILTAKEKDMYRMPELFNHCPKSQSLSTVMVMMQFVIMSIFMHVASAYFSVLSAPHFFSVTIDDRSL